MSQTTLPEYITFGNNGELQLNNNIDLEELMEEMDKSEYNEFFDAVEFTELFDETTVLLFENGAINMDGVSSFDEFMTVVEQLDNYLQNYINELEYEIELTKNTIIRRHNNEFELDISVEDKPENIELNMVSNEYSFDDITVDNIPVIYNPDNCENLVVLTGQLDDIANTIKRFRKSLKTPENNYVEIDVNNTDKSSCNKFKNIFN